MDEMIETVVYIAGKFTARHRLREMRTRMLQSGYRCQSTWMDNEEGDSLVERWRALQESARDLREIEDASFLILDTLDDSATGGRDFEAGYFYGQGPFWLVGPVRNIFHERADRKFLDWDEVFKRLAEGRP